MKTSLTLILSCLSICAFSQLFGPQKLIAPYFDHPLSVTTADLDNDGDLDILCASRDDDKVSWFKNENNEFGYPITISSSADGANTVIATDIDGDGDEDIVSSSYNDDKIAWYENFGDGNFSTEIIVSNNADGVKQVIAIDIDEDGDTDLLSASEEDDKIAWYENNGDGTFSPENVIATTADGAQSVFASDLDGDGDLDVLSASKEDDKIAWYQNDGEENFSSQIIIDSSANSARKVYAGDFDGDGDADVIAVHEGSPYEVVQYTNEGTGDFPDQSNVYYGTQLHLSLDIKDFDEDGDLDLIFGTTGSIKWFENDGSGDFTAVTISNNVWWCNSVYASDIDGDGDLDAVSASWGDDKIMWFENDGSQNFINETSLSYYVNGASSVNSGDLDGDGDIDVLSIASNGDYLAWHENMGDGNLSKQIIISEIFHYAGFVHASDLDGDGDLDVFCNYEGGEVAWFENDGIGNFSEAVFIVSSNLVWSDLFPADMDGDGDIDILLASWNGDKIAWAENDGNANFTYHSLTSWIPNAETVFPSDLDGDGDLDILCPRYQFDYSITWIRNEGDGEFSSPMVVNSDSDDSAALSSADIDGDGDMDIISADDDGNGIWWWENDGAGNFNNAFPVGGSSDGAWDIYAFDFDQDGDIDIAAASRPEHQIVWYKNLGGGVFASKEVVTINVNTAREIGIGDLNGDGYMDLLSSSLEDHKIAWYENMGGYGCLDSEACNYCPDAIVDDGSCCYALCGCTNEIAQNFNPEAECDDASCIFSLNGFVYNDIEANGEFDGDDYGLGFQTIQIEPGGVTLITNEEGEFSYETSTSENIIFSIEDNPIFPFNTTDNPIIFDPESDVDTNLEFGISSEFPEFEICIDLYPNGNGFLCNDWANHNICYRNLGNVPIDGIVELEYDALFQGHAAVTPIDSTNGNIVYMSFENLSPGEMFFYDVSLLTPTVDHIGEYVTSYARVTGFYEGEQAAYGEQTLEMEITCAYDPNDKQAFPLGYTDEHWLLQETEQEFLIRFQNTGNAPAQNIRIQDTLDVNFDIESFKLIANSHSVMTTIDPETRLIDFYFEDIQLPDSVNNEPDSHGLVSYKITPLPDLPVQTVLENTAYIYFDNNDPIITNTTWTTIHECGGESVFEANTLLICEDPQVNFVSNYEFLEEYSWQLDGMVVGMESEFLLSSIELPDYDVTLIASNPLCTETTTIVYEVIDVELIDPCLADFTCDGIRNSEDLLSFLSGYGCIGECDKDLNGNGLVNAEDLMLFLALVGKSCWE